MGVSPSPAFSSDKPLIPEMILYKREHVRYFIRLKNSEPDLKSLLLKLAITLSTSFIRCFRKSLLGVYGSYRNSCRPRRFVKVWIFAQGTSAFKILIFKEKRKA